MSRLGVAGSDRRECSSGVGEVLDLISITEAGLFRAEAAALSERDGVVGGGWLARLLGGAKGTFLGERARWSLADGVVLQTLVGDDGFRWEAAVVEPFVEGFLGQIDIGLGEAEGLAGKTDLVNEVADFKFVKVHESGGDC